MEKKDKYSSLILPDFVYLGGYRRKLPIFHFIPAIAHFQNPSH